MDSKRKVIAVDFDGTLVTNRYPNIGEPIMDTIFALKKEQAYGALVILWTCRSGIDLANAINWCSANNIHIDAANQNVLQSVDFLGTDTRKVYADEYWDDRAVKIPKPQQEIMSWP